MQDSTPPSVINIIISDYKQKSKKLKQRATIYLVFIAAILILGITAFLLAGFISETKKSKNLEKIQNSVESLLDTLNSTTLSLVKVVNLSDFTIDTSGNSIVRGFDYKDLKDGSGLGGGMGVAISDSIQINVQNVTDLIKYDSSLQSYISINTKLDTTKYPFRLINVRYYPIDITLMVQSLNDDIEKLQDIQTQNSDYINFMTVLSTRIGILILVIFFLQLLIRLYRYDMRLANYFDARAKALELHFSDSTLPFDRIVNLLSPDIYDIGTPKSPTDSLAGMFKK